MAARLIRQSHGWGTGLGTWAAVGVQRPGEREAGIAWLNLHNDWLQSVVELGPVPALCGVGLLVSTWWSVPASIGALYGALLVTMTAIWSIVYFPMHEHAPSLVLIAALSMVG